MQNLWDSYREKTHINLVISGSAYRMMQKIFMDKDEPLFNRADHIIRLQPFRTEVLERYFRQQLAETSSWRAISAWWRSKAIVYKGQTVDAEVDIVALPAEGKKALVAEVKRKKEEYKHELFMLKVDYLKQSDLRHYSVETRLLTLQEM